MSDTPDKPQDLVTYPTNSLLGVIDDPAELGPALRDLEAAGFTGEAVSVFSGEEDAQKIDASGTGHGVLTRLLRLVQAVHAVDQEQLKRYEEAARSGKHVLAVRVNDSQERERAREVLNAHGGHFINFYGRMTIQGLEP